MNNKNNIYIDHSNQVTSMLILITYKEISLLSMLFGILFKLIISISSLHLIFSSPNEYSPSG